MRFLLEVQARFENWLWKLGVLRNICGNMIRVLAITRPTHLLDWKAFA